MDFTLSSLLTTVTFPGAAQKRAPAHPIKPGAAQNLPALNLAVENPYLPAENFAQKLILSLAT